MDVFDRKRLDKLYKPADDSAGEDNGQVTIIGGSELFHGAPILSLKVASRVVDMVFFGTPESSVGRIAEQVRSQLMSFIWVPWEEIEDYVEKSDSILIGPGFMRFRSEKMPHGERAHVCDEACRLTTDITKNLLTKFPNKKWVVDAGSLQTLNPKWIPKRAILTPNKREFETLFSTEASKSNIERMAVKHSCVIVLKGPETFVASRDEFVVVKGGNPGLTKGGTGDIQAGLTVALLAKNDQFLAASAAAHLIKVAADLLFERVGFNYNADDLANELPVALSKR